MEKNTGVGKNCKLDKNLNSLLRGQTPPTNFNVITNWNITEEVTDKKGITSPRRLYDILSISYSNDPSTRYYLYDPDMQFADRKEMPLCIKSMSTYEISKLKNITNQPEFREIAKKRFVKSIQPIDIKKLFSCYENDGITGKDVANFLVTDGGVPKDKRIIFTAQSRFIPLKEKVFGLGKTQRRNCHSLELTNSGSGKTETGLVCGYNVHTGTITEPFLLGGKNERGEFIAGAMSKPNCLQLDEFNFADDPDIITFTFQMLENGISKRSIKGGFVCRGTTTLTLSGNLKFDDDIENAQPAAVDSFINRILFRGADAVALGRRIGIALIAYDLKTIEKIEWDKVHNRHVPILRETLQYAIHKYYPRIIQLFRHYDAWIEREDDDYLNSLRDSTRNIIYPTTKKFFEGMQLNSYKLKSAAIRKLIFDNIDSLVLKRSNSEVYRRIDAEKDDVLRFFQTMNLNSAAFCSLGKELKRGTREYLRAVKSSMPSNAGYRKLAKRSGISHQAVKNWLGEGIGDHA